MKFEKSKKPKVKGCKCLKKKKKIMVSSDVTYKESFSSVLRILAKDS